MSREIKFRAWHKVEKCMFEVFGFDVNHVYPFTTSGIVIPPTIDDVEMMQYTGLKDKNGKEIYEGDIVKYNYNNQVYQDVYAKVEYSIAGFRLNADYISRHLSRHIRIANTDYYEVVGNIYENPELLEVQND
ncbi:MAG: YopX family protein [Zhenhengia sp.]|uniref:YopX family protein n=1 Tax=Zhenhengia sp. TaxID=2944208 RepID=UPI003995DEAB